MPIRVMSKEEGREFRERLAAKRARKNRKNKNPDGSDMTIQQRSRNMRLRDLGMLTGGQAKIAAKAPPTNKIDAKDFAVLRAEKAKGRGKGLQDEKMKPGKIMKADKGGMGEATKYKKYLKGLKDVRMKNLGSKFLERRAKLAGTTVKGLERAAKATRMGKIAAGVAAAALAAKAGLEKMYEKKTGKKPFTKRPEKKMGGGMMMQRPMMASKGKMSNRDKAEKETIKKLANRFKGVRGSAERDVVKGMGGYMGGGMMMRPNPVGYKTGKMIKARGCKLGRNKPTKMY